MSSDTTPPGSNAETLRDQDDGLRALADSINQVLWIATAGARRILYISSACEKVWGCSVAELHAHPDRWLESVLEEDRDRVAAARSQLPADRPLTLEYRIERRDGSVRWIEEHCHAVRGATEPRVAGIAADITERKEREARRLQAQRIDAVGQLAGGLAHDLNNVLTIITGYSRLLLDEGRLPPEAAEPLTQIYTAGVRAGTLTHQLLLLSRRQAAQRRSVDLNRVVEDMIELARRLLGTSITLDLRLGPGPLSVHADVGMLEQLITHLVTNARDAMGTGGTLTLATTRIRADDAMAARHPHAKSGDFAELRMHDTGRGIPPELLPRIFEPFFTTKEPGRGMGLGLATVFAIVQAHEGWIEVESSPGEGTLFRVLLPLAEAAAPAADTDVQPEPAAASPTLLLVEDEPVVREFAAAILRRHGYRVLQAGSATDALEVWKWHASRVALLISDVVLPDGLSGPELAARLQGEKPGLPVIITTGFGETVLSDEFRRSSEVRFVQKPYTPQALLQSVREALETSACRTSAPAS